MPMVSVDETLRPSRRYRLLKAARRLGLPFRWRLAMPSAFVTGSVGKTTTCSMVAAILAADGGPAAEALTRFVAGLDVPGHKVLIVTEMGNRSYDWIRVMCRAFAPGFDRFVCCDWEDPRGRRPGETARMLAAGFIEAGVARDAIMIEKRHDIAIRHGCGMATDGDLVVVVSPTSWRVPGILGLDVPAPRTAGREAA